MLSDEMTPRDAPGSASPRLPVDPIAVELGERFLAAGHRLYLVGGSVRDAILQRDRPGGPELDFATDARPEETLRIVQGWADRRYLKGVAWGTVGARKGERPIEITTFRKEVYREDDRHPEVEFGDDLVVDLSRRDFTVNAMAIRLPERELVDPHGGVRDLASRTLDTPLDPSVSFGDDPLRMLRGARFVATLGLTPAPRVVQAMSTMAPRLAIVSAERIQDELNRLLRTPRPSPGLELVVRTGLAAEFLPELPALQLEQDPVHRHKDVLRHTFAVVERCQADDLVLRLAALLHDVGKPATRQITPEGVQFHHHEVVGARMAERRLRELRYPNDVVADVVKLVEMHLRFHTFRMGWSDAAVRRYVRDAGPLLDRLNQLTRADATTANPFKKKTLSALQDELELRIARLAEEENLDRIRPPLDGNQVMEHLGLRPGPVIGQALAHLLERRLDQGPIEEEEAFRLLDEWWAERAPLQRPSGEA
jgi:poly(A) polymerase